MSSRKSKDTVKNYGYLIVLVGDIGKRHFIMLFDELTMAFILPSVSNSCSRTRDGKRFEITQKQRIELTQIKHLRKTTFGDDDAVTAGG